MNCPHFTFQTDTRKYLMPSPILLHECSSIR
uniref:Uncharacterized protein n=1 Tax=Rhizophora mucronata TaxID=61149 RepID=A0A2P2Q8W8_RHIMU